MNKILLASFSLTLLTGIDVISVAGVRLSLIPLIIFSVFIIMRKRRIPRISILILLFIVATLPSLLFTYDFQKSFSYVIWTIINFIAIIIPFSYLVSEDKDNAIRGMLFSFRFQIALGILLFISGVQGRAHLLYYEPSYFALALTPYILIVAQRYINQDKKYTYKWDLILVLISLYITKSANLLLILILSIIVTLFFGKNKIKSLIVFLIIFLILIILAFLYINYSDDLMADTIRNIISSPDKITSALVRTGNRWPRLLLTYDIAISHFWGVGLGAFASFTDNHFFPMYVDLPWYLNPLHGEGMNIYLELAATGGWISLLLWVVFNIKCIFISFRNDNQLIGMSLIVILLALNIESNIMRPYYWMILGMCMCYPKKI
ncbi:hypothetical protein [Raoultella ornithinolytica]|uniref:hypothetical protein n=2 Tax=Raoultella ornithinolytica TaxID=54291 RepID=UPI001BDB4AFB|nr:hypothetical protein [Raoultella ornithinolytica]MCF6681973.1 hypothetical protein [Raoultella ornithinolytica]HDT6529685.1 hypothetical protein [Raoultella ornithinolytica]